MSQNSTYSDDYNTNQLSPLNFKSFDEIKKVPSSPELFSKYSKNCPKYKIKKVFYKEKDINSKNTKSSSIITNITNITNIYLNNSNNIIISKDKDKDRDKDKDKDKDKERNKIYNNLTNILSQFLLNEELLLNSNFTPRSYVAISKIKNISENKKNNNNNYSDISKSEGEIYEYLLFQKNDNNSLLPNIIETNKNDLSYEKCYYYKKLSENIVSFYNEIIYNNEIIFPLKKKLNSLVLKLINQNINTSLKPYNIINLIIYGSQASGLSLPESDIDLLLIYYDSNNSLEMLINELYKCLQMSNKFHNVTSLPKASSPLIKIEYKTNINEIDISVLHMDISFHNIFPNKNSIYFTPSLLIVKYIQRSIEYLPQSKNIIILIKKYLKNIGLNNYYTGGLSSFSIFLMVFSFYKYVIKLFGNDIVNNYYIGQFLIQFLDFYSKFNFNQYIININKDIPFIVKEKIYINENKSKYLKINFVNQNNMVNAVILDPFTLNNIAANSFRIGEIQLKFDSLKKNLLINYQKIYKIKNIKKNYNNYDKYNNNKGKYNYHFQYKSYKSMNSKDNYSNDDDYFNEKYYFNIKTKSDFYGSKIEEKYVNKISFEEYEKEIDLYNNDIFPNFLELSIK